MEVEQSFTTAALNVGLRIPAWFILEAWLLDDNIIKNLIQEYSYSSYAYDYGAILITVVLLGSSLKTLTEIYRLVISSCLLLVASKFCKTYLEKGTSHGHDGGDSKWFDDEVVENPHAIDLPRMMKHIFAQCIINSLVGYLLKLSYLSRFTLMVFCVPIICDVIGLSSPDLVLMYTVATRFVLILALVYMLAKMGDVWTLLHTDLEERFDRMRNFGALRTLAFYWYNHYTSVQITTFWMLLYECHVLKYIFVEEHPTFNDAWYMVAFTCVGEVCGTSLSIIGCCFTVSYFSKFIIYLTRALVLGRTDGINDELAANGWTEGCMMFLLTFQIDLPEMKPLERAYTLSIILFLVVSSLIQSMYEIIEPHLLALSATLDRGNMFSHMKTVFVCIILFISPLIMSYYIFQLFDFNALSLIIVASFAVTSIMVLSSLIVYTFFVVDSFLEATWQGLDDAVYYTRATTRVVEFIVALFVVGFGLYETIFGEWSWINSFCLLIHLYFSIWMRLQEGWNTFLLRRNAVRKIESLNEATAEQLEENSDICAICHQEMTSARVTHCKHFFHSVCLRKWLYVQESCPLCHKPITPPDEQPEQETATSQNPAAGDEQGTQRHDLDPESLHQISRKLDDAIQNLTHVIREMEEAKQRRLNILEHGNMSETPQRPPTPQSSMDDRMRTKLMECAQTLTRIAKEPSDGAQTNSFASTSGDHGVSE